MGSTMGLVMTVIMDMPPDTKTWWIGGLGIVSAILIIVIKNQSFIYEKEFAKSMAIAMATGVLTKNPTSPFIKCIAQQIIKSQQGEIQQMKQFLISNN